MRSSNFEAIYVLWLREMKRTIRAKSRIIGSLAMPLFFMAFLGFGFNKAVIPGIPQGVNYMKFLIPGIIGMTMLFTSMFAGISVLWDKEFGFLKEIMVAPVNRISIVLGRIAGGATIGVMQGVLILMLAILVGFRPSNFAGILSALLFMIIISITFIGLGLIFASKMKDIHGFSLIMNFVIFPIFFLSGALFPLNGLPNWLAAFAYVDPLTYGVDGLRRVLISTSQFPLIIDILILLSFSILMVSIGAYLFEKSEVG